MLHVVKERKIDREKRERERERGRCRTDRGPIGRAERW